MSVHLQRELNGLKKNLLSLSSLVESNLSKAVKAMSEKSEVLSREVQETDKAIDLKEVEVEEECLKILALHQPVAIDLRFVIATLKINNDLERIGDLAVGIAKRARYLSRQKNIEIPFNYDELVEKTRAMLSDALDALIDMDSKKAIQVMEADDEVDALNREAINKVFYGIKSDPEQVEPLIHYLTVSRSLERIADYATNIAEDVLYMVEGRIVRHGEGAEQLADV